jgi:hypothetical protein
MAPEPRIQQVHIGNDIFIAEKHEVKGESKPGFSVIEQG